MRFGEHLRHLRRASKLSQNGLARKTGLCTGCISALEQSQGKLPSVRTARLIARALGISLDLLTDCTELEEALPC
jgi:transcriptional regulator with XRE-family HTH domain